MPRPNLGPEFSKCSDAETKTSRAFSALVAPGPIPSNFEKKDLRIWNIEFNGREIIFALRVMCGHLHCPQAHRQLYKAPKRG